MTTKNAEPERKSTRRQTLKVIGGLAGLLVTGQFGLGCSSDDGPTDPGGPTAKDDLVLFVPGFMSQIYTAFSIYGEQVINAELRAAARVIPVIGDRIAGALPVIRLPIPSGGLITFDSLKDHFDTEMVEYADMSDISGFNTQQGVVANGEAIANHLDSLTDKRVTIVSHSKGGLDTLQALLENQGLWDETVAGWVALQPPFRGSPVADNIPAPLAGPFLTAFGGDQQALLDLKTVPRGQYMDGRTNSITELTTAIPVISCYTTFTADPAASIRNAAIQLASQVINANILQQIAAIVAANLFDPAQAAAEAVALIRTRANQLVLTAFSNIGMMDLSNLTMAEPNDGLVPQSSAVLPGATFRKLNPQADHAAPVMDATPFKNFWTEAHRNAASMNLVNEVRGARLGIS